MLLMTETSGAPNRVSYLPSSVIRCHPFVALGSVTLVTSPNDLYADADEFVSYLYTSNPAFEDCAASLANPLASLGVVPSTGLTTKL